VSAADLLAAYDAQLRGRIPDPPPPGAEVYERDGPVVRIAGWPGGGFVGYRDLGGVTGAELDALIARQVAFFRERAERFEWKTHSHDAPADLTERLRAAGFEPEETETVVIGRLAEIAAEPVLPDCVAIREVTERADLDRIARMEEGVSEGGGELTWIADMLGSERTARPDALSIFVAEAGDAVVSAAWVRFERGTSFATFWGGGTLPEWRRRGIYRALVAHRARLALARGFELVEVDASDDSRPILERLGFVPVTTTTPWIWSPR
jgi:GNAT superfamily N-acetyltransferase